MTKENASRANDPLRPEGALSRRILMVSAAVAPAAAMLPAPAKSQEDDLDALIEISERTGISLDDVYHWLSGVDLNRVVENVRKPSPIEWSEVATRSCFAAAGGLMLLNRTEDFPLSRFMARQLEGHGNKRVLSGLEQGDTASKAFGMDLSKVGA